MNTPKFLPVQFPDDPGKVHVCHATVHGLSMTDTFLQPFALCGKRPRRRWLLLGFLPSELGAYCGACLRSMNATKKKEGTP